MVTIFVIIKLLLILALIIGLVNPALILRKSKNPKRIEIVALWFIAFLIVVKIGNLVNTDEKKTENKIELSKSNFESARRYIVDEDYTLAKMKLRQIDKEDSLFSKAQLLLKEVDSLYKKQEEEKIIAEKIKNTIKVKEQLESEINTIKSVDFSTYRGSLSMLQLEIKLFRTWGDIITNGEKSEDSEVQKLAKQFKSKVVNIQVQEFPKLRKEYSNIVAKEAWEDDIYVTSNGSNNRYINFTGGVFVANKNKKDFQEKFSIDLRKLRFTRANYRWHKGQEEYEYYTMYEGKDSDLVISYN